MAKRRLLTLLAALFCALPLSAAAGISMGMRNSSVEDAPLFMSLELSCGPVDFYAQTDMGQINDFVLSLAIPQGKTITHSIPFSLQIVPEEGGFATASYLFGQNFDFTHFFVRYAIGLQAAYAFSPHSRVPAFSLSPMGEVAAGAKWNFFSSEVFLTTFAPEERSWKSTPVVGCQLDFLLGGKVRLYGRAYAEIAELFMQPYILISAYGFRVGLVLEDIL